MKPGRDAAQRWLRQAEHDWRIARGHHERADYSDACFMAEQAAQKALKAFLMWQGQRSVPLHSVAQLAERCTQFDPDFAGAYSRRTYPGSILHSHTLSRCAGSACSTV